MTDSPEDWSPADNPYAIAVSEARWWLSAVNLAAARLKDRDDPRSMPVSSRQIDGRILVLALAQMLTAEKLAQFALEDLAMDPMIGSALAEARSKYMEVLPGIQEMRNAMTHWPQLTLTRRGGPRDPETTDHCRQGAARRRSPVLGLWLRPQRAQSQPWPASRRS